MTDEVWTNPGGDAKIKVRECGQCGWVIRHPIRWCSNCGGELRVVEIRERESIMSDLINFTWIPAGRGLKQNTIMIPVNHV